MHAGCVRYSPIGVHKGFGVFLEAVFTDSLVVIRRSFERAHACLRLWSNAIFSRCVLVNSPNSIQLLCVKRRDLHGELLQKPSMLFGLESERRRRVSVQILHDKVWGPHCCGITEIEYIDICHVQVICVLSVFNVSYVSWSIRLVRCPLTGYSVKPKCGASFSVSYHAQVPTKERLASRRRVGPASQDHFFHR